MSNPNENCLEGMSCVQCGSFGPFRIEITAVGIFEDGGMLDTTQIEWGDESWCMCPACGYGGKVYRFKEER